MTKCVLSAELRRIADTGVVTKNDRNVILQAARDVARLEAIIAEDQRRTARSLFRRTDPSTSSEAARYVKCSGVSFRMATKALEAVLRFPDKTAKELEQLTGYGDGAIRKRLNDLRHAGLVENSSKRKCTVSGRTAHTWCALKQRVLS